MAHELTQLSGLCLLLSLALFRFSVSFLGLGYKNVGMLFWDVSKTLNVQFMTIIGPNVI